MKRRSLAMSAAGAPVFFCLVAIFVALHGDSKAAPGAASLLAQGAMKTAWGEPDLQGIWTDLVPTRLQRVEKYGTREFFTDAEIKEQEAKHQTSKGRDFRPPTGSEADVAGAYNALFDPLQINPNRPVSRRTSMIVDPPNGRIPPLTAEAQKRAAMQREYKLAILQATDACKNREQLMKTYGNASCAGGTYSPTAPRRNDPVPFYNVGFLNRADGPEDRSLGERCMGAPFPDFTGFRRIVQSPGAVSMFYDTGQGQGWHRDIPVTDRPHIPAQIRRWKGDSRGRWDGATLVVDVTNFSPETDFFGSRENLHLVERWTRIDANTLDYAVTIEDPTTWTQPWTVKQQMTLENAEANRIYYEPRCHEGNFGLVGMLLGARAAEKAFQEHRGPDPAAIDLYSDSSYFRPPDDDAFREE